jgi:hypothetical protein
MSTWKRRKRGPKEDYQSRKYWIGRPYTGTDPENIRSFGLVLKFFSENPRPASFSELVDAVRSHSTDNQTQPEPWQFIAYLYDCWWLIEPGELLPVTED